MEAQDAREFGGCGAVAVDAGSADPNNIAIMGGSYGGYATLVGLTLTPDLFTCGVDIVAHPT
jgi:dipeptidyl aminopeptidase/acylaminoacyl peptidase